MAGLPHLLQDVHALHQLRALHLQRLQPALQGRDGLLVGVLLLPLPLAVPLVRAPAGCGRWSSPTLVTAQRSFAASSASGLAVQSSALAFASLESNSRDRRPYVSLSGLSG